MTNREDFAGSRTDPPAASYASSSSQYIITGAAGHLGSTILRELAASGCEARGLLMPGEVPVVQDSGIQYYSGNICDMDSLRPLFEGAGGRELIVIHTAAMISIAKNAPKELHEVNVDGVRNILRICREYPVSRLVHVSSVHAIPELPDHQVMCEPASFSASSVKGAYAETKAEAAQAVLDAVQEGLDAVIVFPSGIIGPYDRGRNHLIQMAADYMNGKLPACVKGGYDFVDVRDAAHGCLLAARYGKKGQGYILSGHYVSIEDLLALIGRECGREPVPALPAGLAKLAVPLIAAFSKIHRTRPLFTAYSLDTLSGNSSFSNEKAKNELHYTVREIEATVRDMVKYLANSLDIS